MNIGAKLKKLRTQQLLTLQNIATKTNLTKGYISQLENNQNSPSLKTLEQILDVLGVSLEEFFAPDIEKVKKFSKGEQVINSIDELNVKEISLIPNSSHYVDLILLEIETYSNSRIFDKTLGDVSCLCLEGQTILNYDNKKFRIKKGETLVFPGVKEFSFENRKESKTKVLVIITPPNLGGK